MLKISKKTDYALIALCHLCQNRVPATAKEISGFYSLPGHLLANIMKKLASSGILDSKRGVNGGYVLYKNPESIYLGDIIKAMEGPFSLLECTNEVECGCHLIAKCPTKEPLRIVHQKIDHLINTLSLAELANYQQYHLEDKNVL